MRAGRVDLLAIVGGTRCSTRRPTRFTDVSSRCRCGPPRLEGRDSEYCHGTSPGSPARDLERRAGHDGTVTDAAAHRALYGRSAHELLSAFLDDRPARTGGAARSLAQESAVADFEAFWRKALHDASSRDRPSLKSSPCVRGRSKTRRRPRSSGLDRRTDGNGERAGDHLPPRSEIHDGRSPTTAGFRDTEAASKMTWTTRLPGARGPEPRMRAATSSRSIEADGRGPRWCSPVTRTARSVHFGTEHEVRPRRDRDRLQRYVLRLRGACGRIRPSSAARGTPALAAPRTLQHEGRDLVRVGTLAEYSPTRVRRKKEERRRRTRPLPGSTTKARLGVAIDLSRHRLQRLRGGLRGENNIPVVARPGSSRREMQWLRIDRYYEGPRRPGRAPQRSCACMRAGAARWSVVGAPATARGSTTCLQPLRRERATAPKLSYKVRRFNFLQYSDEKTPVMKLDGTRTSRCDRAAS